VRHGRLCEYLGGHAITSPSGRSRAFATDIVANIANNATTIPDGMVVLLPETSKLWKSGPKAAETATANQMETITSDAHISRASIHVRLPTTVEGSCDTVDITPSSCRFDARSPSASESSAKTRIALSSEYGQCSPRLSCREGAGAPEPANPPPGGPRTHRGVWSTT